MLLQMEYEEERAAHQKVKEQMGVQRCVSRGDAWFPVRVGRSYYNSLNQLCVEVYRSDDETEQDHNFEFGRPVSFFKSEELRVKSEEFASSPLFTFRFKAPFPTSTATAW